MSFFTVRWADSALELLDQRLLPGQEKILRLESTEEVARAIEQMAVRGAPAIGVTAAMGVALALVYAPDSGLAASLASACTRLRDTRPTAVNLGWALDRMQSAIGPLLRDGLAPEQVRQAACREAPRIHDEDVATCRAMGDAGAALVSAGSQILTHCNAGALATAGYGTALGVVRSAYRDGKVRGVLACETRPFLQGARLTAWELQRDGIPVTLITDSMAGSLMRRGEVDLVVVGADRIAANGDVANKIGTYSLAVLAQAHSIPFYVAAPFSTLDRSIPAGEGIPIEQRSAEEVLTLAGQRIAPYGVPALHPAFDVTPARLLTAIITEQGVCRPPYGASLVPKKRNN